MICKICGSAVEDGQKFCSECGAMIDEPIIGETPDTEFTGDIPSYDELSTDSFTEETPSFDETPVTDFTEEASSFDETPVTDFTEETPSFDESPVTDFTEEAPSFDESPVTDFTEEAPSYNESPVADFTEEAPSYNETPVADFTEETPSYNESPVADFTEEAPVKSAPTSDFREESAAASPAPIPAPAPAVPQKPAEDKSSVKIGGGRVFGAVLVSIFTVLFLTVFGLLLSAKIGLNGNVLKKSAERANLGAVLDAKCSSDGTTAVEYIYNNIGSALMSDNEIARKDLRSFLIKADFGGYAGEKLERYADYLIDGKSSSDPSLSSEEFTGFFKDNRSAANEEMGYKMTTNDYNNMAVRLENRGFDKALDVNEWSDAAGFSMSNTHYAFSYLTLAIVLLIVLAMIIWTAIILDKQGRWLAGFYSHVMRISGIIMLIPALAILAAAPIAASLTNSVYAYLAFDLLMPFALIMLCTGVFELILAAIFKAIKKHCKKKSKTAV